MATFVVTHGAWSAGWAWKKMRSLLGAAGHELWTPTYTGLGERVHLASPAVDLDTHIRDVIGTITCEDLCDVVLIGHSYGGMVATGVADRARERIAKLIYLDAFVPEDGQCLIDLVPDRGEHVRQTMLDGWKVPPNPLPPDTPEGDLDWILERRVPQPLATFTSPLRLSGRPLPPRSYIYCTRAGPGDVFAQFARRAKERGWPYYEIDASHNPHITAPAELATLLDRIAR